MPACTYVYSHAYRRSVKVCAYVHIVCDMLCVYINMSMV